MNARKTVITVVMLFVGLTMCFAENPHLGTWKLNEARSKVSPGTQKNLTVSYETVGDNIKATLDGVDGQGNRRIMSGRASSMAKIIRLPTMPLPTHGRIKRLTIVPSR
jgi:hypothetical protein